MFTDIKTVYIPNPTNPERPEVKINLYYQSGKGYTVSMNAVKRGKSGIFNTETCNPMDAKLYNAGRCSRRSKERDAAAIAFFNNILDQHTATIEARTAAATAEPTETEIEAAAWMHERG